MFSPFVGCSWSQASEVTPSSVQPDVRTSAHPSPGVENRAHVDAGQLITLNPLAGREAEDRLQLAGAAQRREIPFGRHAAAVAGSNGLRRRFHFPDGPAAVVSEVSADGAGVRVAAGADNEAPI